MPQTRPPAPIDPQIQAFHALVGILQADPMLAGRNVTWAVWSGSAADPSQRNPSETECPFVRITLLGGGRAERQSSDGLLTTYRIPLTVQITTMVAGGDVAEATGLANLIYGALWPNPLGIDPEADPGYYAEILSRRQAIDDRWRSVGVSDVHLRIPILPTDYYSLFIASEGEVELWQFVNL